MRRPLYSVLSGLVLVPVFSGHVISQEPLPLGEFGNNNAVSATAQSELVSPTTLSVQGNDLLTHQWVKLSADGGVVGSVVALSGPDTLSIAKARVSLVQSGTVVAYDDTDVDGEFQIEGVAPGSYSLLIKTTNHLGLLALTVLDSAAGQHLPQAIEIPVVVPASGRVTELLRGQTIPGSGSVEFIRRDPLVNSRRFADSFEVAIDNRGGISGQLSKPMAAVDLSETMVYVVKNGVELMRTRASSDGKFRFDGVTTGCYGLVASGPQGAAAVAFCAVKEKMAYQSSRDLPILVRFAAKPASSLNVELAEPNALVEANEANPEDENLAPLPPMIVGNPAGSGAVIGGGGGGFGAGGGLFPLAALGGLIGVAIAASDNNNDNPTQVTPVTPSN